MNTNVLSCGDNLDILRRYLPDAAVDLAYLDPPVKRLPWRGWAGMGIQFIDHSPTGLAGTAWTFQNFASIAALLSGLIAFVVGIVELRTARRPAG